MEVQSDRDQPSDTAGEIVRQRFYSFLSDSRYDDQEEATNMNLRQRLMVDYQEQVR
jgi:hypothetical protein